MEKRRKWNSIYDLVVYIIPFLSMLHILFFFWMECSLEKVRLYSYQASTRLQMMPKQQKNAYCESTFHQSVMVKAMNLYLRIVQSLLFAAYSVWNKVVAICCIKSGAAFIFTSHLYLFNLSILLLFRIHLSCFRIYRYCRKEINWKLLCNFHIVKLYQCDFTTASWQIDTCHMTLLPTANRLNTSLVDSWVRVLRI